MTSRKQTNDGASQTGLAQNLVHAITVFLRGTKVLHKERTLMPVAIESTYEWLITRRSLSPVSNNGSQVSRYILLSELFEGDLAASILQSICYEFLPKFVWKAARLRHSFRLTHIYLLSHFTKPRPMMHAHFPSTRPPHHSISSSRQMIAVKRAINISARSVTNGSADPAAWLFTITPTQALHVSSPAFLTSGTEIYT